MILQLPIQMDARKHSVPLLALTLYVNVSFTASPTIGYVPLNVNFSYNGSTSSSNNYFWTFGDGGIDTVENPTPCLHTIDRFINK